MDKLSEKFVVLLGAGGLGCAQANLLVRRGVAKLLVVDRDFIEESDLPKNALFDNEDVLTGLPKAYLAEKKLKALNSRVQIDALVADINLKNIESTIRGAGVVLSGVQDSDALFLLNDACVKLGVPWTYGTSAANAGTAMMILPKHTPCLRCVPDLLPESGGARGGRAVKARPQAMRAVASFLAEEALKVLMGANDRIRKGLYVFDPRTGGMKPAVSASSLPAKTCPVCGEGQYDYLEGRAGGAIRPTALCGKDTVKIRTGGGRVDFAVLSRKLARHGDVKYNESVLSFKAGPYEFTVFPDGQAVIKGTRNLSLARGLYAKYVGL